MLDHTQPKQRVVIVLKMTQDLTFEQIGDKLNITPQAAHQLYWRGMHRIQKATGLSQLLINPPF